MKDKIFGKLRRIKIKQLPLRWARAFGLSAFILMQAAGLYGQADAGDDKAVCKGATTGVEIGGMGCPDCCYSWSPTTGLDAPKELHPKAKPTTTTKYTLTVVGPNFSFKDTDEVEVEVVEIDKVQFMKNGTWVDVPTAGFNVICLGSSITFRVIAKPAGVSWPVNQPEWSGVASGTGDQSTATFSSSGAQQVTVSCGTSTKSVPINVQPPNTGVAITWDAADYSSSNANGSSTAVEKPFVIEYKACSDIGANRWNLRVKKITGDITIVVKYGGSRNPITNPPINQAEANAAVTIMKDYYSRGSRGSWHTEAASQSHEMYHYQEWQCSSNHYWPATEVCLENLHVPYDSHANEAAAITGMNTDSNAIITKFKNKAHQYWFTLPDNASSRPYAAGQLTLNTAIISVQNLAATNGWTVPTGVSTPSTANPCFKSWLGYACP